MKSNVIWGWVRSQILTIGALHSTQSAISRRRQYVEHATNRCSRALQWLPHTAAETADGKTRDSVTSSSSAMSRLGGPERRWLGQEHQGPPPERNGGHRLGDTKHQ